VPFTAVLPYPDQESVCPPTSRQRYDALLGAAARTVVLQNKKPESRQQAGGALARRDAWLARSAHEALVVWDGDDAAIGKQVRTLQDKAGEDNVWIVTP
jgi:hypothetical protein